MRLVVEDEVGLVGVLLYDLLKVDIFLLEKDVSLQHAVQEHD